MQTTPREILLRKRICNSKFSIRKYPDVKGPRPVIEQAYKDGYITDGVTWMAMKKSREQTSHTYDEPTDQTIAAAVKETYFAAFQALLARLEAEKKRYIIF